MFNGWRIRMDSEKDSVRPEKHCYWFVSGTIVEIGSQKLMESFNCLLPELAAAAWTDNHSSSMVPLEALFKMFYMLRWYICSKTRHKMGFSFKWMHTNFTLSAAYVFPPWLFPLEITNGVHWWILHQCSAIALCGSQRYCSCLIQVCTVFLIPRDKRICTGFY